MKLNYFKPAEFGGDYEQCSIEALARLDAFRGVLGYPCYLSTDPGAVGRYSGPHNTSQHNIDMHGECRAFDLFPSRIDPQEWLAAARAVGFRGFGVYANKTFRGRTWAMCHLDTGEHKRWRTWGEIGINGARNETTLSHGIDVIEQNILRGVYGG